MKHHKSERKSSAKDKALYPNNKAVKSYLLENAKQSFYVEGVKFSNDAWDWYRRKMKSV